MKVIGHEPERNVDKKNIQMIYMTCEKCRAVILFDESELTTHYDIITSRSCAELTCPECGTVNIIGEYRSGLLSRKRKLAPWRPIHYITSYSQLADLIHKYDE